MLLGEEMATKSTVGVDINVSDNGTTKKVVKQVQELHSSIKQAQAAADTGVKIGGTSGSRTAAAAAYMPTSAAASAAPKGSAELMQYGNQRGSAGVTGAAGRDFANQAQGLGGLVRLYATYAANVFAVGAAFTALSNAMDTSNMVKGLDQLGAASGTALGSLSKRFAEATDGAVSLRESMEAVTKASSAGMSDRDILRIAVSAKQAAQALGVDMSDAVSRLTRGITKMEPELLDELGIFIRVDDVVGEYAKSVGKSASALTDFERRMAYANSTLEQAERKFGTIKLDTNAYTQLLAVVKNTSQSVLELVNVALVPLVQILSSSPTALMSVLGAVGVGLVKQAVPALSDYRKSLALMSEEAKEMAKSRLQDLKSSLGAELALKVQALDNIAAAEADSFEASSNKLAAAGKKVKNYDKRAFEISQKELHDISKEEIAYLENLGTKGKKISSTYADMALNLRNYTKAEEMYNKAKEQQSTLLTRGSSLWTTIGQNELEYHNQVNDARRRGMVSSTAYTASTRGFVAGIKDSWANFKDAGKETTTSIDILNKAGEKSGATFSVVTEKMGLFSRGMLLAKLSVVSTVAAIGTAINAFMGWIQVITLVVAAFGIFSAWMSKNKEQAAAFDSSLKSSTASIKTLGETLEFINNKPFGQQFSTSSLEARAKAFGEVGASVKALAEDLAKVDKSAGEFDKFIDQFKKIWGGDVRSKFADSMTETVVGALDAAANTAEGSKAREKIAKLLNIDPKLTGVAFTKAFNSAVSKAADNAPLMARLAKETENLGIVSGIAASRARELDDSLKSSGDAYKAVTDQFKSKDPIAVLGESLITSSQKLAQAMVDPTTALQKLTEIAADPDKLKLFSAEDQASLMKYASQLKNINNNIDDQTRKVEELRKERTALQVAVEERAKGRDQDASTGEIYSDEQIAKMDKVFAENLAAANAKGKELAAAEQRLLKSQKDSKDIIGKFPELASNQLQKGADLLVVGISAAMAKASSIFKETVLGSIGNMPGVAKAREKIELSKIASENALILATINLQRATMENTVAIQLATAKAEYEAAATDVREGKGTGDTRKRMDTSLTRVQGLERKQQIIERGGMTSSAIKSVVAEVKAGNQEVASDTAGLLSYLNGLAGANAQLAANAQRAQAARYTSVIEQTKQEFAERKKLAADDVKNNNNAVKRLDNLESANSILTEENVRTREGLLLKGLELSYLSEKLDIEERLAILAKAQATGVSGIPGENFKKEVDTLNSNIATAGASKDASVAAIKLDTAKKVLGIQVEGITRAGQLAKIQREINNTLEDTRISTKGILEDTAAQTELFTGEYLRALESEKALQAAQADAQRARSEESAAFELSRKTAQAELNMLISIQSTEQAHRLEQDMAQAQSMHEAKLQQIEEQKQAQLRSIEEIAAYREEREDFNSMIENIKGLDTVWAGVGTSISGVLSAQDAFNTSQNQFAATLGELQTRLKGVEEGSIDYNTINNQISKTQAKQRGAELAGYAKIVGAAKSMFKEKTTAHKALAATEKALQLKSLAFEAATLGKQIALWWSGVTAKVSAAYAGEAGTTAATTSGFLARLPTYIKEIYASWGKMGPWMVGAATAFIAATLLKGGGGGSAIAPPTAEQRQEVQGTAMGYDSSGKLVQTSRGVFGDTGAKSESIGKSIDRIKETSIEGLKYDNKVVGLLSKINDGINNTAKSLYSIRGLREGSMFGTNEGQTKGKGLLGSGIFGSKKTTNITDSGLLITATFADLANTTSDAAIQFYEDVTTTKKKWYGSSKTRYSKNVETADQITQDYFNDIFSNATDLFKELGQESGIQVSEVLKSLEGVSFENLSVSLRGLKGEDLEKELNAVISSMLDQGAEAVFASFAQFANFGEGMLETVIRVTDNNKKVEQALKNIGMGDTLLDIAATFTSWSTSARLASMQVTEALITGAGSLDDFLSQASFYSENFLSEQERLSIVESAVTEEMRRLSTTMEDGRFTTAKTSDEFSTLIEGLDLTTVRGRETYQALMNVAPGFKTLIDAADAFASSLTSLIEKVFSLTGQDEALLASQRAGVLKDTDPGLKALQEYVFALEDLKASEDSLAAARKKLLDGSTKEVSTLKNVTQAMRGFIDSLKKFKDSLFLDQASILTPAEKYAEAKRQFDLILATATGDAVTPEEQKAKDTALGQIESAARAFLDTSKIYNASSSQYVLDFGLVTSAIDSTSLALETQLTAAEQAMVLAEEQVALIQSQLDALNTVDDSIASLELAVVAALDKNSSAIGEAIRLGIIAAGSLSGNTEAASTILGSLPQFAKGGLASGWSIAGENGAELIDFKTPGRVYTAEQTFGMFNGTSNANAELVQEVRMLRKEVSALRAQQSKETGHLITATYDAQHKNAEEVTDGVSKSAEKQIWAAKVASKAVLV